ncbi:MAG: endonuclease/exonuclease/phosphatase family protein [Acidimicrobiales bacterium]
MLALLWVLLAVWLLRLGESTTIGGRSVPGCTSCSSPRPVALLAVLVRRRALAGAALATIAVHLLVSAPLLPLGSDESPAGPQVTVGSWNALVDNDDPDAAARILADDPPDVLVLQELTPETERALRGAGLLRRYPHRVGRSEPGTTGEAIWSRFPVLDPAPVEAGDDVVAATIEVPGGMTLDGGERPRLRPQPGDPGIWARTLHDLDRALGRIDGPWIAVGDFNATSDHRAFRDLLHDAGGTPTRPPGGATRTWPADGPFPPLVLIDHAIVSRQVQVAGTAEQTLPGSDHRMIRVDLTTAGRSDRAGEGG